MRVAVDKQGWRRCVMNDIAVEDTKTNSIELEIVKSS